MKLPGPRVDAFLKRPDPAILCVLIYGGDDGLVRERAATLVGSAAGSLDDPFRVANLVGSELARDPARLSDEAAALSMMGGQRVVWVRDAGDPASPAVKQALDFVPAGGLVVLEAGDLEARSSLRKLCEASPRAATIACYMPDEAAVEGFIRSLVREGGYRLEPDALAMLAANLVADRQLVRREVEKLLLYAGEERTITLSMAAASVGDSAEQTVEDAVFLAADGDLAGTDRAAGKVLAEGDDAGDAAAGGPAASPSGAFGGRPRRRRRRCRRRDGPVEAAGLLQGEVPLPQSALPLAAGAPGRGDDPSPRGRGRRQAHRRPRGHPRAPHPHAGGEPRPALTPALTPGGRG